MTRWHRLTGLLLLAAAGLAACGGKSGAQVQECEPAAACACVDGTERDLRCVCQGGSTCTVAGDSIEFTCEGNAACSLDCGTDCLITCPGTTSCTVAAGEDAVVACPGTASCDVTCRGDCTVEVTGTASAVVRCDAEEQGAACTLSGCGAAEECGGGVYACRTACPPS